MKPRAKTNSIRIIAGQWRGRRLPVLDIDGLRPSTDRVRETLFNWLMHDIAGARCLDLFAGSGALGLECLSRGASSVVFVESDKRIASQLQQNLQILNCLDGGEVIVQSAINFLRHPAATQFDLVFLDPPFDSDLLAQAMPLLVENGWLADGALVYVEQASKKDPEEPPQNWQDYKEGKAGYCRYTVYQT
ncbi:MAG: 16S rRNA (guanine(966)-N(2))-methyltransferase RsmD [Arenicella sp.]|nr:16S rRNA (guanine(966)-N(2))-methyltransferase RsmD [Arenicella sp.]